MFIATGAACLLMLMSSVAPSATAERIELTDRSGYRASLWTYRSAGLAVRALVAEPFGPPPADGFPVIVANHGFVPNPARYGVTAAGENRRPGDYYRAVPELFTAKGFVVVMPDYRGHNDSEGAGQTSGDSAPRRYADDVRALLGTLVRLERVNLRQVFVWGHSMGAEVTLRALAPGTEPADKSVGVRGVALWSAASGAPDSFVLSVPVQLQHSEADPVAPSEVSRQLAATSAAQGRLHALHLVPGSAHMFEGQALIDAVERDVRFFRGLLLEESSR
jgi:uncharacterized protein